MLSRIRLLGETAILASSGASRMPNDFLSHSLRFGIFNVRNKQRLRKLRVDSQVSDSLILESSFGSVTRFPYFLQVSAFTGAYVGMNALTSGSETGCSTRILTSNLLQCPQPTVSLEKNGKNQKCLREPLVSNRITFLFVCDNLIGGTLVLELEEET